MADVTRVIQSMRIDALTVEVCSVLRVAGVPHLLLKGPTTARWLYEPPRGYVDIDLLLPMRSLTSAVKALAAAGTAAATQGDFGEAASHSQVVVAPSGIEIDLHATLPMLLAEDSEAVWRALTPHQVPFMLDTGTVTALDAAARCLVVALHCLGSGPDARVPKEDLRRALATASPEHWLGAAALADELRCRQLLDAAIAISEHNPADYWTDLASDARLRLMGATGPAFQLARLRAAASWRRRLAMLAGEIFPSTDFMREKYPSARRSRRHLMSAYAVRLVTHAKALPAAVRAVRLAIRAGTPSEAGIRHSDVERQPPG